MVHGHRRQSVTLVVAGSLACLLIWPSSAARAADGSVDEQVASAMSRFAFKLFSELTRHAGGQNLFLSPASIAVALAMTYNGARGATQQVMAETLQLSGLSQEDVNRGYTVLMQALQQQATVELSMANSLWADQGVRFNEAFIDSSRTSYGAEVATLDFSDREGTARRINGWVSQETRKKITEIVKAEEIDVGPKKWTVLFLLNAIYFKGRWAVPFDKAKTQLGVFHLGGGRQKPHPLMSRSGKYRYFEGADFQAVSLPYGDGRFSMYVFLPDQASSLEALWAQLNDEQWQRWMHRFRQQPGEVVLPRFTVEYEVRLDDVLKAMGMGLAFSEMANFRGMSEVLEKLWIDMVKHKAFVEVNEEGTEAAAATVVEMVTESAVMARPFRMVVDRPFFFAIRDGHTGTLLFLGAVVDPQES